MTGDFEFQECKADPARSLVPPMPGTAHPTYNELKKKNNGGMTGSLWSLDRF